MENRLLQQHRKGTTMCIVFALVIPLCQETPRYVDWTGAGTYPLRNDQAASREPPPLLATARMSIGVS